MKNELAIGVDIGGTKITAVVLNGSKVLESLTILTPKNLSAFLSALERLLSLLSKNRHGFRLGIGLAGIVSYKIGKVINSPNMKFLNGFNFHNFFYKLGYKSAVVENDANCFAYAESRVGKGVGLANFVGITLGTGIGGGLIIQKQIYTGAHGGAGELGQMLVNANNSFEFYFQKARDTKDYKKLSGVVAQILTILVRVFDPQAVIFGGSVAIQEYKNFLAQAVSQMKLHIQPGLRPKIIVSKLNNAGAIGAALLAK